MISYGREISRGGRGEGGERNECHMNDKIFLYKLEFSFIIQDILYSYSYLTVFNQLNIYI
jgi:hypothetical protein